MSRVARFPSPVLCDQLADAIAGWVRQVPAYLLVELAVGDRREAAATAIGEIIVAEMTMTYPELVDSVAPPLPF